MKLRLFIFFQFLGLVCFAQNLVPNPGFEEYFSCPTFNSTIQQSLYNWYDPTSGSADYYNTCLSTTVNNNRGVPYNYTTGFQYPRNGNGYSGIYFFADSVSEVGNNPREYIAVRLLDSLRLDSTYCISFFVNMSNFYWYCATSNLQVYFSKDSIFSLDHINNIDVEPQFKIDTDNFITDTLNWTEIKGQITAAGGERFMCIGNFYNNHKTKLLKLESVNNYRSYYYIDDVSVYKGICDTTTSVNNIQHEKFNATVYPNPASDKLFLKYNTDIENELVEVYDLTGRILSQQFLKNKSGTTELNINGIGSGIYFIKVSKDNQVHFANKIVINK